MDQDKEQDKNNDKVVYNKTIHFESLGGADSLQREELINFMNLPE